MTKQWDENFQLLSTAMFSEAWKDELKELAAKVSLSSQLPKGKKEVQVLLKLKIYPVFNSFNRSMNILVISIISLAEYNLFGWDVRKLLPTHNNNKIISIYNTHWLHSSCSVKLHFLFCISKGKETVLQTDSQWKQLLSQVEYKPTKHHQSRCLAKKSG